MKELEEAGWEATGNKTDDEIKNIDMKEMFDEADQERRNSHDLVAVPRKVVGILLLQSLYHFFRFTQNSTGTQWQKLLELPSLQRSKIVS